MSDDFDWNDAYLGDGSDPLVPNRRLLAAAPSVPGRALDLGCGTGGNAIALAEAGWDVTGVDIASRAIASARIAARRRGAEVRFEVADVTAWVPAGEYHFVLSAFALPARGSGRQAALRMALDALAPGGTIVIAELDVAMTRVFGTEADFIDVAEMGRHLRGLEAVSIERTRVRDTHDDDPSHDEGPASPADHWAVVGIGQRPRHRRS